MRILKNFISLLIFTICSLSSVSQEITQTIRGRIYDNETQISLP